MALIGAMCSELRNKAFTALYPWQPAAQSLEESALKSHRHVFLNFFLHSRSAPALLLSSKPSRNPAPAPQHSHLPYCTHNSLSAYTSSTEMLLPEPHPSTGPGPSFPRSICRWFWR
uniref:Uncharacterized protein n=1 Tax=Phasianus colchicus TaxID=9054 RepID=A0A669QLA2_PHACC